MHFLSPEYQDSLCALQVIAQMLNRAARYQLLAYMHGEYGELPVLGVLMQLQALARHGVCSMTRVLEDHEMPSLARLLDQLPEDAHAFLESSFAAEKTGLCAHEPLLWGLEDAYLHPDLLPPLPLEDTAVPQTPYTPYTPHSEKLAPLVLNPGTLSPELRAFEHEFMRRYQLLKRLPSLDSLAPSVADLGRRHSPPPTSPLPMLLVVPVPELPLVVLQPGQPEQEHSTSELSSSGSRWARGTMPGMPGREGHAP